MSALEPQAEVFKLASVLLQYPTLALFDGLDHLGAAASAVSPRATRDGFGRFLGWLRATPPTEVAQHYVETFDLRRHCARRPLAHREHGNHRSDADHHPKNRQK